MKKILSQISLILLIMCIGMISVFITDVNADSVAGLNCPTSTKVGSTFKVALILPSNAYTAEATITVKFSDGSTTSGRLVYMSGMADYPNSVSLSAKVAGNATVTASNIIIGDSNGNTVESGGSKSGTINIIGDTPSTPSNPGSSTSPSVPNENNGGTQTPSTNNNNNNTNNNNTVNFTDVNETVYTTERCNVRKSYSTSSEKITTLSKGASVKRTGVSSSGWSRVEYNGTVCYISSQYLTTTKPAEEEVKFKDVEEKLYATQSCNLRKSWSTDSDKVGYLTQGEEVTRTGVADNGWSRISYKGQTVYVASRLLTTEKKEDETEEESEENIVDTNEIEEKTDEQILAEIKEEVGVLPEVGNNIATIIYTIITSMAVIGILAGIYYIKRTK